MRPLLVAALAFIALPLAACDAGGPDPVPFDPSTVDYDQVQTLEFGRYVQPLLAARNVFAASATTTAGSLADYAWGAIFNGPAGETIVPFDEEGSFLTRFVEDLREEDAIPYPNLRRLEADELRYVKRWIAAGARNDDGTVPYSDARHVLYAAEQAGDANSVALIDMERGRIIRRVYFDALGVPSGTYGPHHLVFEPDGSAWYVSLVNGGEDSVGRVLKLSTSLTMDPGAPGYLLGQSGPFTTPGMMALDATTNRLFVGRSTLSQAGTSGIGVMDRTTMAIEEINPGYSSVPHALALTADGRFVLTASLAENRVTVLDAATGDIVSQLDQAQLGATPRALIHFAVHTAHHAAAPGGHAAHTGHDAHAGHAGHGAHAAAMHMAEATLTSQNTDEVLFFRLEEDGAISLAHTVGVGDGPFHAHGTADGTTLLVPNRNGNTVSIIDVATRAVREVGNPSGGGPIAQPHTPAPGMGAGNTFWVSSSNLRGEWAPTYRFLSGEPGDADRQPQDNRAFGNVAQLNVDTGAVVRVIQLRAYPSGLEHPMHGGHH